MAYVTADVEANPGGELPFKVVFKQGETELGGWEVETKEEGEEQIVEFLEDAFAADEDADSDDEEEDDK